MQQDIKTTLGRLCALVDVLDSAHQTFPAVSPHSGGGCHIPFPPAVFCEVPLAERSCGRQVHPVLLSAFRRKEVWQVRPS